MHVSVFFDVPSGQALDDSVASLLLVHFSLFPFVLLLARSSAVKDTLYQSEIGSILKPVPVVLGLFTMPICRVPVEMA